MSFVMVAICMAAPKFTLVIDAGHGGKDPGTRGVTALEKDINLKVALAFGKYVENNCSDVKVVYTRKTDVFIELSERAAIANRNKADLFISIHSNALPDGKISRGFETYTLGMHRASDNLEVAKRENSVILVEDNYKQKYAGFDPKSSESYIMFELMQDNNMSNSVELAKMIQTEACSLSGRQNKGVHQAGFLVLRATSMPACLIELGFLTTPDEEEFLNSANGQDLLAHGIFNAFVKYKKKYGNKNAAVGDNGKNSSKDSQTNKSKEKDKPATTPKVADKPAATTKPATTTPKVADKPAATTKPATTTPKVADKPAATTKPATTTPKVADKPAVTTAKPSATVTSPPTPSDKKELEPKIADKPVTTQETDTLTSISAANPGTNEDGGRPIFKVQIGASSIQLSPDSPEFKGVPNVQFYTENGMIKYTVGASPDFNEINKLRKSISDKFPEAFVIAFRNGDKMDIVQAIREFRVNKTNLK